MKRALVGIAKFAFNRTYKRAVRTCERNGGREDLVVFLSRRTDEASYDYEALAREFETRGWTAVMHLKKVTRRTLAPYVKHVLEEIRLLARCKVAVLDRYDPVVSLLDFECETLDAPTTQNYEFPTEPLVLQLWHAFGAYKHFGYQSNDTTEGHTSEFADVFNIHRNYSWIVCSGEGCREAFAEAFAYPVERVVALNRPEYDELVEMRKELERKTSTVDEADEGAGGTRKLKVLMAPTLRYHKASAHPFRDLYGAREQFERDIDANFTWSFHPLEQKLPAPGNVSQALVDCDLVVTDYSSIAYEAYALGKMVLFYVPDIEAYRLSPGLNADPVALCPKICALYETELADKLSAVAAKRTSYPHNELNKFSASAFDPPADEKTTTARVVDFAVDKLDQKAISDTRRL